MKKITLVVPAYHEEESLPYFFEAVNPIVDSLKERYEFELLFVIDYPDYGTYDLLIDKANKQDNITIVRLSRSFGHEEALAAGLKIASGDAIIPLDADLQDDPNAIPLMIKKWEEGYKVVNGKRSSRQEKGISKILVKGFYKIFHRYSKKMNVPMNVGDFRLLDRVVVDSINDINEKQPVLKISVPNVGYKISEVTYERKNRIGGKTHYKKTTLFKNAFSYFAMISDSLLYIIFKLALCTFIISCASLVTLLVFYIIYKTNGQLNIGNAGYLAWLIVSVIALFSALIEFSIFIVGLYSNRAYIAANNRPSYIIESVIRSEDIK